ncbi:protealysin inhibitor emfourin [Angustibacter sp. McL0619]|uniref:protealysin inhibitor emfourin n=1 Tax=Angustibacter sp. McL0619 TaxID=3415676 RepID=UPI003CF50D2B
MSDPAEPQRLHLERSGGFAGMRVDRQIDLDALDPADAAAWRALLSSPLLRELPNEPAQPDRFVYRLTHESTGVDVVVAEQQLPDDVRELLERTLRRP